MDKLTKILKDIEETLNFYGNGEHYEWKVVLVMVVGEYSMKVKKLALHYVHPFKN